MLLPGVEDDRDGCIERLEKAIGNRKGILRAHLYLHKSSVALCLHYDPRVFSIADVKLLADKAGVGIVNRYHHELISVEGMDCSDCALVLEHSLKRMEGVLSANISYTAQSLHMELDAHSSSRRRIEKRIMQLGYRVPAEGALDWYEENRELLFSLMGGALLFVGWTGERFLENVSWGSLSSLVWLSISRLTRSLALISRVMHYTLLANATSIPIFCWFSQPWARRQSASSPKARYCSFSLVWAMQWIYFVSTTFGAQLYVGHQLVTRWPQAIVRHPMYLG